MGSRGADDHPTIDATDASLADLRIGGVEQAALVLLWAREEPARLGEIAVVPRSPDDDRAITEAARALIAGVAAGEIRLSPLAQDLLGHSDAT